uniref:tRNA (N6-threonylcarbamoyladenosine(37)-N6)-methyltransferase TrmO n=1 Tax=Desulfobacca acetoxidans TaxID=60893 RepID=A0A7V4G8T6_9BACT
MEITLKPIGYIHTQAEQVPRHWSQSDVEGTLVLDPRYQEGLRDLKAGEYLVVIFHLHRSSPFTPRHLVQKPPDREERRGVFSTCSPIRPNPLGLSVFRILGIEGHIIRVQGLDTFDGTPILDLKPYIEVKKNPGGVEDHPSAEGRGGDEPMTARS